MQVRLLLLCVLICLTSLLQGQTFCGHIKYRYIYKITKTGKDVTAKTNDVKTEDFYICGNKFKTYFDGDLQNIYIGDSVTFFQASSQNTFGYIKADSAYGQDVPVYTHGKDAATYNGKSYRTIVTGEEGDRITYYYNASVRVDPASFHDLNLYHWNAFFNATKGGVRLVSVYVDAEHTVISEAVKIEPKKLIDDDFKIPAGYTVQPYESMNVEN
jgi:hypothetical protein